MTSQIVATVPADNVSVDKALIRTNFRIASEEITVLQARTSVAGMAAFFDFATNSEVDRKITQVQRKASVRKNIPELIAYGVLSL